MDSALPQTRHLWIIRHGHSDQLSFNQMTQAKLTDHDRPLSHRGDSDIRKVGAWLRAELTTPIEHALISDARRTHDTWRILHTALISCGKIPESIHISHDLYLASLDQLESTLYALPDTVSHVILIGHNPGLSELVSSLCKDPIGLSTGEGYHLSAQIKHWQEINQVTWFQAGRFDPHQGQSRQSLPLLSSNRDPIWQALDPINEYEEGQLYPEQVQYQGETIDLIVALYDGTFYALKDECPHQQVAFSQEGSLEGPLLVCGWHQWSFFLADGSHSLPTGVCVPTFKTKVEDGRIWVFA